MIVWLTKDVYVKADRLSFDLVERRTTKSGKLAHKTLGYYARLEDAANAAVHNEAVVKNENELIQINQLVETLKEIKDEISKACWGVTNVLVKNEHRVFNGPTLEDLLNFDDDGDTA